MRTNCLTPYSVSKVSGEQFCKLYYNLFGLETVVFRYFNVYGQRQPLKGQYAPVVGLFLEQSKQNLPMTIVGDGLQRRDFTHVNDVVEANILASKSKNKNILGEVLNIGTGMNYNILDLVKTIGGEYKFIDPRPGESKISLADNRKAKELLDWKPKINLKKWILEEKKHA